MKPIRLGLLVALWKANPAAKNHTKPGVKRVLPRLIRRLLAMTNTSIQEVLGMIISLRE